MIYSLAALHGNLVIGDGLIYRCDAFEWALLPRAEHEILLIVWVVISVTWGPFRKQNVPLISKNKNAVFYPISAHSNKRTHPFFLPCFPYIT